METRIIKVFYDALGYPFKDKERTVRYPITGNAFMGASNTTAIKFYIDRIGGNLATWVANGKLANGEMGHQVLTSSLDSELGESYVTFNLTSFYTQVKGDLLISLAGYDGGLQYEEVSAGVYKIYGTPNIQTTGSVKINIAYATGLIEGEEDDFTFNDFFALLSQKLNTKDGIVVASSLSYLQANAENYEDGQVFYTEEEESLYINNSGSIDLLYDLNAYRDKIGIFKRSGVIDSSHDLTESQLAQVKKQFCFMLYTGITPREIYTKVSGVNNETETEIKFVKLDDNASTSNSDKEWTYHYKALIFNASNGKLTSSIDKTINSYTKSGADSEFVDFSTEQVISALKTFSVLPRSSATPSDDTDLTTKGYVDDKVETDVAAVNNKISTLASSSNRVLSQSEIEQKISVAGATYRGLFNSVAELNAYSGAKDNNDYAWVKSVDSVGNTLYTRYIYNGSQWVEEWTISNISFSADQWNAINSGATSTLIEFLENVYNGTQKVAKAVDSDKLGGNNANTFVRTINNVGTTNGNIDVLATITAFSIEVDSENTDDLALYVTHAGEFETDALSIEQEGDNAYLCITVE